MAVVVAAVVGQLIKVAKVLGWFNCLTGYWILKFCI